MAKVSISLDAELVVEVMVLAGVGSPQDVVEVVVRDYIERAHRTEARIEVKDHRHHHATPPPPNPEQG
ncbi:DUF2191 domain-containing protein [Streptomyces sp. NPDC048603]|uniref:DUF2191 domain-containing protein n=1 Tax=Streptomyces sp. NPDC048603 TaxID=3365577 RepID=UPI003710A379